MKASLQNLQMHLRLERRSFDPTLNFMPSGQPEDEHLVRRRTAATSQSAAGEIRVLPGRRRSEGVSSYRQRCER